MIKEGTKVTWEWGSGTAEGTVVETYTRKVEKKIEGNTVVRHGETGDKALLIEQKDGTQVLKKESEVQRADAS